MTKKHQEADIGIPTIEEATPNSDPWMAGHSSRNEEVDQLIKERDSWKHVAEVSTETHVATIRDLRDEIKRLTKERSQVLDIQRSLVELGNSLNDLKDAYHDTLSLVQRWTATIPPTQT